MSETHQQLIVAPAAGLIPARPFAPTPKAAKRVLEFFTAQINNDHTRRLDRSVTGGRTFASDPRLSLYSYR